MLATDHDPATAQTGPPSSLVRTTLRRVVGLPALVLVGLVRIYQWTLSPFIGRQCRFAPTCSEYFIGAVRKYGAIVGSWRGVRRILRCHPWHPGGYDPP